MTSPSRPSELPSVISSQLTILRTTYLLMKEVDFAKEIASRKSGETNLSLKELLFDMPFAQTKAHINYFFFLTTLNQFSRSLAKYPKANVYPFPFSNRIRFYRNKVIEHWDDYIAYRSKQGMTFKKGEPAIPVVEEVFNPLEREQVESEIIGLFQATGVTVDLTKYHGFSLISTKQDYSDLIYTALEQIDPALRESRIPQSLIGALFRYGFPAPICNVDAYSNTLVEYIKQILNAGSTRLRNT